jgi:hypothetical protein
LTNSQYVLLDEIPLVESDRTILYLARRECLPFSVSAIPENDVFNFDNSVDAALEATRLISSHNYRRLLDMILSQSGEFAGLFICVGMILKDITKSSHSSYFPRGYPIMFAKCTNLFCRGGGYSWSFFYLPPFCLACHFRPTSEPFYVYYIPWSKWERLTQVYNEMERQLVLRFVCVSVFFAYFAFSLLRWSVVIVFCKIYVTLLLTMWVFSYFFPNQATSVMRWFTGLVSFGFLHLKHRFDLLNQIYSSWILYSLWPIGAFILFVLFQCRMQLAFATVMTILVAHLENLFPL